MFNQAIWWELALETETDGGSTHEVLVLLGRRDEVNWVWPDHMLLDIDGFNIDSVFAAIAELLPGNPYIYRKTGGLR